MARRKLDGKRAIVTGASTGIGRELAIALAKKGVAIALVARNGEKLEELAHFISKQIPEARTLTLPGDVTDVLFRVSAVQRVIDAWGGVDMLINNAGISALERFAESSPNSLSRIMAVNFFAPVEWIRETLPHLRQGIDPIIVQVSSILGRRGVPVNSAYCASKFALSGWSESVRAEFKRLKIEILVASPGTTETDFFDHIIEKKSEIPWGKPKGVPASKVAAAIVRAMEKRKHEIVPNMQGRLLLWANRIIPRGVDLFVEKWG